MDIDHIGPPSDPPAAGDRVRTVPVKSAVVTARLRFGLLRARRARSVRRAVAAARVRLTLIRVGRAISGAVRLARLRRDRQSRVA